MPAALRLTPSRTLLRRRASETHVTAGRAFVPGTVVSSREDRHVPGADRTLLLRQSGCQLSTRLTRDFASLPHGRFALIEKEVFPRHTRKHGRCHTAASS